MDKEGGGRSGRGNEEEEVEWTRKEEEGVDEEMRRRKWSGGGRDGRENEEEKAVRGGFIS